MNVTSNIHPYGVTFREGTATSFVYNIGRVVGSEGGDIVDTRSIEAPVSGEVRNYRMLIGGEWVEALSGKTFESVNPYTGRVWATAPEAGEEDVDRAVRAAREAFDEGPWGTMTGTERARLMRRLAELIAENAESLAVVETHGQRQAA